VLEQELGARPGEELGVLRHGTRPSALDETHSELVEVAGDGELVRDREVEALLLGSVTQGGVVDVERVVGPVEHVEAPVRGQKKTSRGVREVGAPGGGARRAS
jgi:hypothetical protein